MPSHVCADSFPAPAKQPWRSPHIFSVTLSHQLPQRPAREIYRLVRPRSEGSEAIRPSMRSAPLHHSIIPAEKPQRQDLGAYVPYEAQTGESTKRKHELAKACSV